MSQDRRKQIHRYFHVWDPALFQARQSSVRLHEKVDSLSKLLLSSFQRYWKPGTNVTVDECIEGFTGRTNDIVNIPTEPTPIGFKIWVLADQGYVFDLLWHVKGDKKDQGPKGLRTIWEEKGFSRTQAVVLELMTRMPNGGKGHAVHIDNLFTSSKLLSTLRDYGIGAAGTVRTSRTKREENEDRKKLATQLMAHSSPSKHTSPIDGFGVRTNLQNHVVTSTNACNGVCVIPSHIAKECKACMAQGRTAQASGKRMAMQERSVNSVRIKEDGEKVRRSRPLRTRYGCSVYQIYLCQGGPCWEEHILSTIKA
jgi:hypothetical protein